MLTSIYQICLVMPAPPQFPDGCNHQQVMTIWEMYGENMRRYDSIHNEWDVCTKFFLEDNFDLFKPTALTPFASMRSASPTLPLYPPQSPQPPPHELALDHSAEYVFDSFIDALYYRYGLLCSPESITTPDPAWDFESVHRYILDNQSPLLAIDEVQCTSDVAFFHCLADGAGFSALSDHSDSSSNPFSDHAANFPIIPVLLDSERYFLLSIDEPSIDWCLALCDPISVLQIFHQGWHVDPLLLVMRLLRCGVALNTFFTRPQDEPLPLAAPLPRVPVQLDWRTTNYDIYELARNSFLSRPYARAALLKGGIVGRLAREHLDIVPAAGGPSQDVFTFGTSLHSADGRLFWDDDIDGSEMDLICGVYKTPTGQGTQTADLSWWPKQSTWVGSNFNVGYWTPDNEVWFRTHLEKIRAGEVQPQSARHWANALKKYKFTVKILDNYGRACIDYLSESLDAE